MQSDRDREITDWLARVGAAGAVHVMRRFEMGQSWAYARLHRLSAEGLLTERRLLHRRPGLYVAAAEGLRWTGLAHLGLHQVGPGSFEHAWQVAGVAAEPLSPGWQLLGERELRFSEREDAQPIASARLGEPPGGRPALHRPDLALISPGGAVFAIEVELAVKGARRLETICRAYARARHVERVVYLAAPPAARALARAIERVRAAEKITVLALGEQGALDREVGMAAEPPRERARR